MNMIFAITSIDTIKANFVHVGVIMSKPTKDNECLDWSWNTQFGQDIALYLAYRGGVDLSIQIECMFIDEVFGIER
jgi:hypothetical protein